MKLRKLSLKDKRIFNSYLKSERHSLSAYAFENIYIWKELFDIRWQVIKDRLCVFFEDAAGCFMYLPPLGQPMRPSVMKEVFAVLNSFNSNPDVCRIENVEEKKTAFYRQSGFVAKEKFCDYICLQNSLAELKGDRYKAKRACVNYFTRNYQHEVSPYLRKYRQDCLELYGAWASQKKYSSSETLYQGMLQDSFRALKILLGSYEKLDMRGLVVRVDGKIKAFTFGYALNPQIFCILYEITDLRIKGLAQFIFREFCLHLKGYRYINVMDDSGLPNLKQVKLSYHPERLARSYIITQQ